MTNKRMIRAMIVKRFTHPRVVIDVLSDEWVGEVIKVSVWVFVINVRADVMIGTLSGVKVDVIVDVLSDSSGVKVLADVNTEVLIAATIVLQFTMLAL